MHTQVIIPVGVALVFFLHGANLSLENLKTGVKNWRLHLFVQASTFVFIPLIGFAVVVVLRGVVPFDVLLGFFYLCALPSTISSSVALTAMARGDVAAAVFNATLSGLIGMFMTPLLVGILVQGSDQAISIAESIIAILTKLLLPFVAGHLMQPLLKPVLARFKTILNRLDRGVIVLIVYASFCDSTQAGLWSDYGVEMIALVAVMTGLLLLLVVSATARASRLLGFPREVEITAVFCGSKKSLANGIPMAKVLFASHPALGIIVLPIMLYHQLQLMLCTYLARRYAKSHAIKENR